MIYHIHVQSTQDSDLAELLRQVGQDEPHLRDGDAAGPLLVEDAVRLADLVLRVRLLHLLHHHHLKQAREGTTL